MKLTLRRFYFVSLIALATLTALTLFELQSSSHFHAEIAEDLQDSINSLDEASNLELALGQHRRQSLLRDLETLDHRRSERIEAQKKLAAASRRISDLAKTSQEKEIAADIQQKIATYLHKFEQAAAQGLRGSKLYSALSDDYDNALGAVQALDDITVDRSQEHIKRAQERHKFDTVMGILIGVLILIALPLMAIVFRRFIFFPLLRLKRQVDNFEGFSAPPDVVIEGAKEIGDIGDAFQHLITRLNEQRDQQLTFLAAVAHDLKNPLSAIKMSISILGDEKALSPEARETLEIMERQTDHLNRQVGDLLDRSQIEGGKLELKPKDCDVCEILKDTIALYSNLTDKHWFELQTDAAPARMSCDPLRLSQVFNNLISNAIKYSPEGGLISVSVSVSTPGNLVEISIRDPGIGISSDEIETIFRPFNRSKATRNAIPGIGLGLSTSKKIVEAHRGTVQVKSEKGRGTEFILRFPTAGASARPERPLELG